MVAFRGTVDSRRKPLSNRPPFPGSTRYPVDRLRLANLNKNNTDIMNYFASDFCNTHLCICVYGIRVIYTQRDIIYYGIRPRLIPIHKSCCLGPVFINLGVRRLRWKSKVEKKKRVCRYMVCINVYKCSIWYMVLKRKKIRYTSICAGRYWGGCTINRTVDICTWYISVI